MKREAATIIRQKNVVLIEWLHAVAGKALFYPAAGSDTVTIVDSFAPHVREFHFNDLFYSSATDCALAAPERFKPISVERPDPVVRDEPLKAGPPRQIMPSVLVERLYDGAAEITIHRRRGFGQYALAEFPASSIGVFVHRCDSPGEGGSDIWFLANKRRDHEPLSNLWDKLAPRLADRAIIVSDGSLTNFKFLRSTESCAELGRIPATTFGGFDWRCVGQMRDQRAGLVWGLVRQ